jgi:hypothetical protein
MLESAAGVAINLAAAELCRRATDCPTPNLEAAGIGQIRV